ncbi:A/G-specific adenine glycosylase [bacterium]|nr:A/G-specific adenine glycosylase [candidate division CSSED10-310 bacterium]
MMRWKITEKMVHDLMTWFDANKRSMPWREEVDPYKIWISEVMLQQTQVRTVIPYYLKWLQCFPSLAILADSTLQEVLKAWEGLGYYNRARNIHLAAKYLMKERKGQFPRSYTELLKIPGFGPYIAAAVASIAFNIPVGTADGNVKRVMARLFGLPYLLTSSRMIREIKQKMERSFGLHEPRWINQAWMEFGAVQCKKMPDCAGCIYMRECYALQNKKISEFPRKKVKSQIPSVFGAAFIVRDSDLFLMVKRQENGLLGGLWELPNIRFDQISKDEFLLKNKLESTEDKVFTIRHQFSHFKLSLDVYMAKLCSDWENTTWDQFRWVSTKKIYELPKSKLHIKILQKAGLVK